MPEPERPKADRGTRHVRIYEDTAEKLAWVLKLENRGETVAEFIDGLIRCEVDNRFAPLAKRVEAIETAFAGAPVGAEVGGEG